MLNAFRHGGLFIILLTVLSVPLQAVEIDFPQPNFVPEVRLSYDDPATGEEVSCEPGCRRFEVPAGVDLEIAVATRNIGGNLGTHGVPWDLFFDQRNYPFPGLTTVDCQDSDGLIDVECWLALAEHVDWEKWNSEVADRVCVPENAGECAEVTLRLRMDEDFEGSRGRGVYSFAVWVDRFQLNPESSEFDNFAGPIRVKVIPGVDGAGGPEDVQRAETGLQAGPVVVAPSVPMPYHFRALPRTVEKAFNLTSPKSKAQIVFQPPYIGRVEVEVESGTSRDKVLVQIRKISTGEVLVEASQKGRVEMKGELKQGDLKNDGRLEAVVSLPEGARGTRGTLTVTYPSQPMYRRADSPTDSSE